MSVPTKELFVFGAFKVDAAERVLVRDGQPVAMTQKVFDLLLLLVRNRGHVVEKEELMKEIWPDAFVEEGNLTQNISVLRKALNGDGHQYIQTVPRRGYRFVGDVRQVLDEAELFFEERSVARVVIEEDQAAPAMVQLNKSQSWKRSALILGVTLTVIASAGIFWSVVGFRRSAARNPPPFNFNNVTLRRITAAGNIVYGVISSDGQFVVYSTLDEYTRYAIWLQHTGSNQAYQLIAPTENGVSPVAISHDSNWIYYGQRTPNESAKGWTLFRMPLFGGAPRKVIEGVEVFAALAPDDQRILLQRFKEAGGVEVLSVNALDGSDEQVIASSDVASDYLGTQWSPDGSKLIFIRMEQRSDGPYWSLREMPARGGAANTILPPSPRRIWFTGWADQGRGIVMSATDPVSRVAQLYYVSYPSGETQRITNDLIGYATVSVGADTVLAERVERQSKVWVTDWPNPGPARQVVERDMADGFAWTPDGHIVFDTNDDGRLHLWIADSAGPLRQELSSDNVEDRQPDVSPDGKSIAYISKRSGNAALWLMDVDGRNARRVTADGVRAWRPRFAPDGQSIFFLMERGERTVLARIQVAGGAPSVIADDVYSESFFDVSPDGRRVAYTIKKDNLQDTRVEIRSTTGGPTTASYFDIEPAYFVRFTPDGQGLVYAQAPADKKLGAALWLQSVNGGQPQQILSVAPDLIYWIAWSRDGKQLAISHGRLARDVVLLSRNKNAS